MYARAVNLQFRPRRIDEAVHVVRDVIVPALRAQEGFREQVLLLNRVTGKAVFINFWESEACLVAFESSQVYRDLMARLVPVLAGPPDGDRYQVAVRAGVAEPVSA